MRRGLARLPAGSGMAEALPGVDPRASCSPSCESDQELAVPIGAGFPPARDGGSLGGAQAGLSPTGVFDTCKRFVERGAAGLRTGPRGPEPGHGRFLDAEQETEARDLIRRHTPDEMDLPFALWSRAAVRELILRRFGVRLAVRSMGTYLARWGCPASGLVRQPGLVEERRIPGSS